MTITYTDGASEVHLGPSRVEAGTVSILVMGPEPNEVCRAFRAAAYETGLTGGMECPRPVPVDDGWAVLGRVW